MLQKRLNKRKSEVLIGLIVLKKHLNLENSEVDSIYKLQELLSYSDFEMIEFISQVWESREYS
jgi:hypothetical protein